jgi:hypothetical protein
MNAILRKMYSPKTLMNCHLVLCTPLSLMIEIFKSTYSTRYSVIAFDQHAPLKRTKISRPPAPWMRHCPMSTNNNVDEISRSHYRDARNMLKSKIKTAKRIFFTSEHFHLRISGCLEVEDHSRNTTPKS